PVRMQRFPGHGSALRGEGGASGLTILIVEDERATAWALSQRLEEEGYTALTAPSAEQALAMLKVRRCDLVVADLRLPGISGVDLIRRLKRRRRPIPAIAVTAHGTA